MFICLGVYVYLRLRRSLAYDRRIGWLIAGLAFNLLTAVAVFAMGLLGGPPAPPFQF